MSQPRAVRRPSYGMAAFWLAVLAEGLAHAHLIMQVL